MLILWIPCPTTLEFLVFELIRKKSPLSLNVFHDPTIFCDAGFFFQNGRERELRR